MKRITVTDAKKIGTILDYVHDRTFELSKTRFDGKSRSFVIPLTVISDETTDVKKVLLLRTWKNPIVEATLAVKNASDFSVKDNAGIDQGIIDTITQEGDHVIIKCSVPVEIRVKVAGLELELVLTDTVTSQKKRFALG